MRIFGRVCGFVAGALLILQAVGVFLGYSLHGVAFGIELIALAVGCITDAIVNFKKPKHPYLQYTIRYQDGSQESYIENAEHQYGHVTKPNVSVSDIQVTFFEK